MTFGMRNHAPLRVVFALALVTLFSVSAVSAGRKGYKCTLDTQACLDKMVRKLEDRG